MSSRQRGVFASVYALLAALTLAEAFELAAPRTASAQVYSLGGSFSVPMLPGGKRFSDVAWDPFNGVFLVISGTGQIQGQFVSSTGTPLGAGFVVNATTAYVMNPRLAYSPDIGGFLVTWLDTRTWSARCEVWGRLVAYGAGGTPSYLTTDFIISPADAATGPGVSSESAASVAYATASREFLVSYMVAADIRAQRVSYDGQLLGAELVLTRDTNWQTEPSVAYSPKTDRFYVAWDGYDNAQNFAYVDGQLIQAGAAGGLIGTPARLNASAFIKLPQVKYNSARQQFLVLWFQMPNPVRRDFPGVMYARRINNDASFDGDVVVSSNYYSAYDATGLDYNPVSGTYALVTHGRSYEDAVVEMHADGTAVDNGIIATSTGCEYTDPSRCGNFNPRIAANTTVPQWLISTVHNFAAVWGQLIQTSTQESGGVTPPPPPPPPPTPSVIDLTSQGAPNGSWFFAEGTVGTGTTGFDTYYLIANENGVPVSVRAYFAREDGLVTTATIDVPAVARKTVKLRDYVSEGSYGAVFQSLTAGQQIYVERSMFWANQEGSSLETGTDRLSKTWYFAEGTRAAGLDFFSNYFLLFNPTSTDATVTAVYVRFDGRPPASVTYTVPAHQRVSVYANQYAEIYGADFSSIFTSTVDIVVERSMYWGGGMIGGHTSRGTSSVASTWLFAEGAAMPNFDTYYLVVNPNTTDVIVDMTYLIEGQLAKVVPHVVPALSRATFYLPWDVGLVGAVGAQVRSRNGEGIVAERSIYWGGGGYPNWIEGTNAMGVNAPANEWHLPEGTTIGGFETRPSCWSQTRTACRSRSWSARTSREVV